jgi:hypothetical protein
VLSMGLQSDDRMVLLVAAYETVLQSFPGFIRIEPDGSLDPSFTFEATHQMSGFRARMVSVGADDRINLGTDHEGRLARINAHDERRLESPRWLGDRFEAMLRTRPGRRYVVESSSVVTGGDWMEAGVVEGDGGVKHFRDVGNDRRYYRMRLEDR